MNKPITLSSRMLAIAGVAILILALVVTLIAVRQNQELRRKAATPTGTTSIALSPTRASFLIGEPANVALVATILDTSIDGFQVVATISGVIGPDLAFHTATISGMNVVSQSLQSVPTGKQLNLAYLTRDPKQPYTNTQAIPLGTLSFTPPAAGTMNVTFDIALTKITQNQTTQDILALPVEGTYALVAPTPSPTPTPTPTPSPTPTCTPRPPCLDNPPYCRLDIPNVCPKPTPTTPTPTPIPQGFFGQYYSNKNLSGSPTLTRTDSTINFDWGKNSPAASLPKDKFSVRWTKTENFPSAGTYRFSATTDDGVRLSIDGKRFIDYWKNQSAKTRNADVSLSAGPHTIVMEYYENGGKAVAKLSWTKR